VPYYRLYHFSQTTGGIARFDEFDAVDDTAAEAFAADRMNAHAMELWQQHRKVRRFDPSEADSHDAPIILRAKAE
jgi:hypothetical protein